MNTIDRLQLDIDTTKGLLTNMVNAIKSHLDNGLYSEVSRIALLADEAQESISKMTLAYSTTYNTLEGRNYFIHNVSESETKMAFTCLPIVTHQVRQSNEVDSSLGIVSGCLLATILKGQTLALRNVLGFDTGYLITRTH